MPFEVALLFEIRPGGITAVFIYAVKCKVCKGVTQVVACIAESAEFVVTVIDVKAAVATGKYPLCNGYIHTSVEALYAFLFQLDIYNACTACSIVPCGRVGHYFDLI